MRVGVIGGGLTGLATVHELDRRGIDAIGYEAAPEPGGVIRSTRVRDTVIEHGPQRLRAGGIVREYLETFDLLDSLVTADADLPIFVYGDRRLREVPFDPVTMLRTDLLSVRGKARLLLEPLTGPARDDETVAEYFTRKLGVEAYHAGIEPLLGGLYGSDPAEMPVDVALRPILAQEDGRGVISRLVYRRLSARTRRPPAAVPTDGMQSFPEAIYAAHESSISLDTRVDRIEQDGDGFQIVTAAGSDAVDHVVIATDAASAGELVCDLDDDLATRLDSLRYNPLALVYLTASIDRRGLGYQVRRDEPLHTLGVSWNGVAFGRDDLHTVFLGGMHEPGLVDLSDDRLMSIATREFETVMGVEAEAIAVHRLVPGMPSYDHSWHQFESVSTPSGLHLVGNYTARVGIPGRLRQATEIATRIDSSG